jgi:hypothetical protein
LKAVQTVNKAICQGPFEQLETVATASEETLKEDDYYEFIQQIKEVRIQC